MAAAEIPEDLVFHILCWLPVVSLLRFKSVCKSWRSLIESSQFITQHLHTGNCNGHLVLDPANGLYEPPCFALVSGENLQSYKHVDFPEPLSKLHNRPRIISCCNGIICLQQNFGTILSLWNPATKRYRFLPECPLPFPKKLSSFVHYGFGFVTKTNDYKLVRIVFEDYRFYEDDYKDSNINTVVMVYTLSTDSWTLLQTTVPADTIMNDGSHLDVPFRDGVCCWYGKYRYLENDLLLHHSFVLSFDFNTQTFGTIPFPNAYRINDKPNIWLMLSLLHGKLAFFDWKFNFSERGDWHCKIWVLNESGVNDSSWTHFYTLTLEPCPFPIALSMDGKLIWMKRSIVSDESWLCLCDPVTQELRVIPFERPVYDPQAPIYKESLVSLESANAASHKGLGEKCDPSTSDMTLLELGMCSDGNDQMANELAQEDVK